MLDLFQTSSPWTAALRWIAVAALVAVVIWTLVRAPGRRQDPGLPHNRDDTDARRDER